MRLIADSQFCLPPSLCLIGSQEQMGLFIRSRRYDSPTARQAARPLPADAVVMTDAEMDALGSDTSIGAPESTPGATTRATVVGKCNFAVGQMWKRSSGQGFPPVQWARSQQSLVVGEPSPRRTSGPSFSCITGGSGFPLLKPSRVLARGTWCKKVSSTNAMGPGSTRSALSRISKPLGPRMSPLRQLSSAPANTSSSAAEELSDLMTRRAIAAVNRELARHPRTRHRHLGLRTTTALEQDARPRTRVRISGSRARQDRPG